MDVLDDIAPRKVVHDQSRQKTKSFSDLVNFTYIEMIERFPSAKLLLQVLEKFLSDFGLVRIDTTELLDNNRFSSIRRLVNIRVVPIGKIRLFRLADLIPVGGSWAPW